MLLKLLVAVAGLLVILVVIVAMRPSAYRVERRLEIAAPADVVFGVLDDLHRFAGVLVLFGSPWEEQDPGMQKTFTGPATGVGQSFAWKGNRDVGRGRMTIVESDPGRKVGMRLEFVEPMASTATYALTLADTPAGSSVTWTMEGRHNLLGKAFGLFMDMDAMLGADLEKGLARLKTMAEHERPAGAAVPGAK